MINANSKLLKLNSQVSRIKEKINKLSESNIDTKEMINTLNNIINNNATSIDNTPSFGGSAVMKLNVETVYDDSINALNKLENEIDKYDIYLKMNFSCKSILDNLKNANDKELETYISTMLMHLIDLNKLSIIDTKKSTELINLVYETAYNVIKNELSRNGYSILLGKIITLDKGVEFINDEVKKDLEKFDLNLSENKDLRKRINELSSAGINYSLADELLIIMILLKENSSLKWCLSNKFQHTEIDLICNEGELNIARGKSKSNNQLIKLFKKAYSWSKVPIITTSLLLSLPISLLTNIILKGKNNPEYMDELYMTTTKTYNTVDNSIETIKDYTTLDNGDTRITIYDKVEGDMRKTTTYDIGKTDIPLELLDYLDIDNLEEIDKGTIDYNSEQLSKEYYKLIEQVIDIDKDNVVTKFNQEKQSKSISLCIILLAICISLLRNEIKSMKESKKEYKDKINSNLENDEKIRELEDKCEKLIDEYNKLVIKYNKLFNADKKPKVYKKTI